jgi:hypothetical protein
MNTDAGPFCRIAPANTLIRPVRARELGWAPKHASFAETVRDDVATVFEADRNAQ